jgi:FkbH-like protein
MNDFELDKLTLTKITDYIEKNEVLSSSSEKLKVCFLRNITIDSVTPYIKFFCLKNSINVDVEMGNFDNIFQDSINLDSKLYSDSPDIIIVCLNISSLSSKLSTCFSELTLKEINDEVIRLEQFIKNILSNIRKSSQASILINNFETPVYPSYGILDSQSQNKQINTFRKINLKLLDLTSNYVNTYLVDFDKLQSQIGFEDFFDLRFWHIAKAPYSRKATKVIANEYCKFIIALRGRSKKCLVLDCDNTLWGGIVGEDGINNIAIGNSYPGSAYLEFQNAILSLYRRGIILALCTKNNEKDVLDVLNNHPEMILKKKHFNVIKANWENKAKNIQEIANELNIGLESLVFLDDSEFEINLVKKLLPDVESILVPDDPTRFITLLNLAAPFDSLSFSDEDLKRNQMYLEDKNRHSLAKKLKDSSIEDYLKSLEMEVVIKDCEQFTFSRISQLTLKTNQFNLTTKRYSESHIRDFCDDNQYSVRYLRVKDKFGDIGIVGLAISRIETNKLIINSLLLSCRALGRGIENLLLKDCFYIAKLHKCDKVIGIYNRTEKNKQVESFYQNSKFSLIRESNESFEFECFIDNFLLDNNHYFKSVTYE